MFLELCLFWCQRYISPGQTDSKSFYLKVSRRLRNSVHQKKAICYRQETGLPPRHAPAHIVISVQNGVVRVFLICTHKKGLERTPIWQGWRVKQQTREGAVSQFWRWLRNRGTGEVSYFNKRFRSCVVHAPLIFNLYILYVVFSLDNKIVTTHNFFLVFFQGYWPKLPDLSVNLKSYQNEIFWDDSMLPLKQK